jgi:hypothetical protein
MFRRILRTAIRAIAQGEDPKGVIREAAASVQTTAQFGQGLIDEKRSVHPSRASEPALSLPKGRTEERLKSLKFSAHAESSRSIHTVLIDC